MCEQCSSKMSPTIGKLAEALAKAQLSLQHAKKDSANPFYKSKYADLTAIVEALKKTFSENGLAYSQLTESHNGQVGVTTILMHSSGEWVKGTLMLKPVKEDPQAYGSAITYARRYGLQAIAGLSAEDDDDGNAASRKETTPKTQPKQQQTPKEPTPKRKMFLALQAKGLTEAEITDLASFVRMCNAGELTGETMLEVATRADAYINEWKTAKQEDAKDIPFE